MWDIFRRRKTPPELDLVDDGSFEVVAESLDPASSDSAVLDEAERAGVALDRPLVLRHRVGVPEEAVAAALEQFAVEGYLAQAADRASNHDQGSLVALRADKTVTATGLGVAQERARVAGMVARLGGDVHGWQLLAPPATPVGLAGYDRGDR
ncbi:MAG: hypothetical protein LH630_07375 [Actinomycetia bacterium]|nr:hypothetical protein [Actinomycetes bacterium]